MELWFEGYIIFSD